MSGFSCEETCPNCGKDADGYTDHKPFNFSSLSCLHCGLQIFPQIEYQTLEELNDSRIDSDMEPLEQLPEQSKDF